MITCRICGEQEDPKVYAKEIAKHIWEKNLCVNCLFWKAKVTVRVRPNVVRINGHHFTIDLETEKYKGFGGQKFTIKFFDGRVITTTNLWYQGKIPEHFRKTLEDNAKFVEEEKP